MSEIRKYVLIDTDGQEQSGEYDTFAEAEREAIKAGNVAVVAYVYEYSDQELVWTPNGDIVWPS